MFCRLFLAGAAFFGALNAVLTTTSSSSSVWVTEVPTYVRPYAIPHYMAGGCAVGAQIYRFPVTGPSSDSAFTLVSTNAPGSTSLGVLPHIHEVHYENFFNFKGRFQLSTEKYGEENTRVLTQRDYGAVPHNTTHTFQILDPDTEMVGVIQPGGFDPRTDAINGTAPLNTTWHTGSNDLATDAYTPFFVAKDYGLKYLNSVTGYQVVQPFITGVQSADNFTLSTITIDKLASNATVGDPSYPGHATFEVLEGQLQVVLEGELISLLQGDVVFIPGNTTYKYWSVVAYTKFLHIAGGGDGLDAALIGGGESWDSPV